MHTYIHTYIHTYTCTCVYLFVYASCVHEQRKQKDKAVLVLGGSGGVGSFAVQIAKRHFDCFTAASCSAANADFVRELGADEVLHCA